MKYSLSGELLCEVARPIGVVAESNRCVESQPLEGYDAEKRRQGITRLGYVADPALVSTNKLFEERFCLYVSAIRDDDGMHVNLLGHEFAHVGQCDALILFTRIEHNKDSWCAWVNHQVVIERIHGILHGEALAMQVCQLFHLEAALLSNSLS